MFLYLLIIMPTSKFCPSLKILEPTFKNWFYLLGGMDDFLKIMQKANFRQEGGQ